MADTIEEIRLPAVLREVALAVLLRMDVRFRELVTLLSDAIIVDLLDERLVCNARIKDVFRVRGHMPAVMDLRILHIQLVHRVDDFLWIGRCRDDGVDAETVEAHDVVEVLFERIILARLHDVRTIPRNRNGELVLIHEVCHLFRDGLAVRDHGISDVHVFRLLDHFLDLVKVDRRLAAVEVEADRLAVVLVTTLFDEVEDIRIDLVRQLRNLLALLQAVAAMKVAARAEHDEDCVDVPF